MLDQTLPAVLLKILENNSEPEAVFSALMPALGEVLQSDRCFLYLRDPHTRLGKVSYCWCRTPEFPEIFDADWKPEPESLAKEDPLFAAALRTEPSIFVEDVETANPKIVNKAFEHKTFGHKALIHAHLCFDNQLWGILQPCVFNQPRIWNDFDRFVISHVTEKITPLAVAYMKAVKI
ncbi:GAF domain-containing protein [Microcoleus sp. FACHB-672]|uniref:GAF domain-containing protein n=1 Tax=Microcoleus sp. FACHB-672 TaxID=2692825 RepID=UPI0016820C83|nr:GAF domain-containing protein [Microcoleus sp. FACHB-672]MBD2042050.1 GAF domain-containing protein [Microcoleus sp. FACHB-672]